MATQYPGLEAFIEGTVTLSISYKSFAHGSSSVAGDIALFTTRPHALANDGAVSDIEVSNYDTVPAVGQSAVEGVERFHGEQKGYILSFLRGGTIDLAAEDYEESLGTTNLDYTASPTDGTITSDTGDDATLPLADDTNAGLLAPTDFTRLADVEADAKDDQSAEEVPFDPTGTSIVGNNVQDALVHIHDDKIHAINPVPTTYDTAYALMHVQAVSPGGAKPQTHIQLNASSSSTIGLMTAADKAKLDSIVVNYKGVYQDVSALNTAHPAGVDGDWAIVLDPTGPAQHHSWDDNSGGWEAVDFTAITGTTNLGYTPSATQGTITSDTGADATIPAVDSLNAGLMLPDDFDKLGDIEPNAKDDQDADEVPYDNTTSAMAATDTQAAIDELDQRLDAVSDTDDQTAAEVSYDNTAAQFIGATTTQGALDELDSEKVQITTNSISIYVDPGESIQDAYDELLNYRFKNNARGYVILRPGDHVLSARLITNHPQGELIDIRASGVVGVFDYSTLTGVRATDEALLDAHFPTRVTTSIEVAQPIHGETLRLRYILFKPSGVTDGIRVTDGGILYCGNCCFIGFHYTAYIANQAYAYFANVGILYDTRYALRAAYGGTVYFIGGGTRTSAAISYTSRYAVHAYYGSFLRVSNASFIGNGTYNSAYADMAITHNTTTYISGVDFIDGTGDGMRLTDGVTAYVSSCTFENLGGYALELRYGSVMYTTMCTFNNNAQGAISAQWNSMIRLNVGTFAGTDAQRTCSLRYNTYGYEINAHVGSPVFSPAIGVVGNNESTWI